MLSGGVLKISIALTQSQVPRWIDAFLSPGEQSSGANSQVWTLKDNIGMSRCKCQRMWAGDIFTCRMKRRKLASSAVASGALSVVHCPFVTAALSCLFGIITPAFSTFSSPLLRHKWALRTLQTLHVNLNPTVAVRRQEPCFLAASESGMICGRDNTLVNRNA